TGALFLLVGMLYDRYHTRKFADYSGMGARLRLLAAFFVFITMSSIGLPGLNGFVGEVLVFLGAYGSRVPTINGVLLSSLAALGVILGAWYMLTLLRSVFCGELKEPHHEGHAVHDLDGREIVTILLVAVPCLVIGLYPQPVIQTAAPEIKYVTSLSREATERARESAALPFPGTMPSPAETEVRPGERRPPPPGPRAPQGPGPGRPRNPGGGAPPRRGGGPEGPGTVAAA